MEVGTGETDGTSREISSAWGIVSLYVETGEIEETGLRTSGVRRKSTIVDIESSDDEGLVADTTGLEAGDCLPGAPFFLR